MSVKSEFSQLVAQHQRLDACLERDRKFFLSDWEGSHPFVQRFLGPLPKGLNRRSTRPGSYIFFDEQVPVLNAIAQFHSEIEDLTIDKTNIAAGPGSSSFLAAISLWLLEQRYKEVYYVPPLYYTLHFFLRLLGIRMRPVSGRQPFETRFSMNLPASKTVLLLTDPVWYAGKRFTGAAIREIGKWQEATCSIVIVDGSFQYMQWNRCRLELTSTLVPELTLRLVCPTKALAIPAYRFAYLLHPAQFHDDFLFIYESVAGSANGSDLAFAKRALEVLLEGGNVILTDYLKTVYRRLVREGFVRTSVNPECGYFAFAIPDSKLSAKTMGQEFFELRGYPGYVRVNLMKAANLLAAENPD